MFDFFFNFRNYYKNWYCDSDRIYRLPFDKLYTPISLDGISQLYQGLDCSVKLDSYGLPIFNVDCKFKFKKNLFNKF